MSSCDIEPAPTPFTAEDVRLRVGIALFFLELAARTLETPPLGETTFSLDETGLYRYLLTGKAAGTRELPTERTDRP